MICALVRRSLLLGFLVTSALFAGCSSKDSKETMNAFQYGCSGDSNCAPPSQSCYSLDSTSGSGSLGHVCSMDCSDDSGCSGGRCIAFHSGGLCLAACGSEADCASGHCVDVVDSAAPGGPTKRVCWPVASSGADCTAAKACSDCTALTGCGWCKQGGVCASSTEGCAGFPQSWTWDPSGC